MIAYLPSQWSWEFLHNVKGSRVRRFRMVDMCKGIQKDWLQGTSIVLVVGLHMVGIEDIVLKQQGDISLHFSNHRIPSFILFFSSYFFSFLSFSRIFLLFSEPFHRTLSIKHRYANLQSGSLNFWSPSRGQRGLGQPAGLGLRPAGRPGAFPALLWSVFLVLLPFFIPKLCFIQIIHRNRTYPHNWVVSRKRIINKIISGLGFRIR